MPRENLMLGVGACYLKVVVRDTLREISIQNVFVLNCKLFILFHVCLYCSDIPLFIYPHYADMYVPVRRTLLLFVV